MELYFKDEAYKVVGICMEVHRILGHGFLEIVYKDAIEHELIKRGIEYTREKEYTIHYKDIVLSHSFFADFVVYDKIILELKATEKGLCDEFTSRVINYLKASGCKLGLLVNFGAKKLQYKRLVF